MASCRDTPGWPMSTSSTSSLTERSPWRSASISRRRVGSARTWNTSGIPTYYCSVICLVNDMSGGGDWLKAAQLGQHLGQPGRRSVRGVAPHVDDLLGDAHLQVLARLLEHLVPVLAVPEELMRAPDLRGIAPDGAARVLEFADDVLDGLVVAAGDVPDVRVARDQAQRGLARGADPERRVRLLPRVRGEERVL